MPTVTVDTRTALHIVEHIKRLKIMSPDVTGLMGFLVGDIENGNANVTDFVYKSEHLASLIAPFQYGAGSSRTLVGIVTDGPFKLEYVGDRGGVHLKVTLPEAESMKLELEAQLYTVTTNAATKLREPSFEPCTVNVGTKHISDNVVMAAVMADMFPEVAAALGANDILSLDFTPHSETAIAAAEGVREAAEEDASSTSNEFVTRANEQLELLSKIADQGPKSNTSVDPAIAKEISSIRSAIRKETQSMLREDGSSALAEGDVKDALMMKYISVVLQSKLDALQNTVKNTASKTVRASAAAAGDE